MARLPIGKGVTVFDGATGTVIQSMGLRPGYCPDVWCLEEPSAVAEVHRRYAEAGAQIVETNTFGANPLRLSHFELQDRVRDINVSAVRIAREAVGGKALVAGCIGPLGSLVEPLGEITFDQAYDAFAAQVKALVEGGPDLIVIDTIADLNEMRAAILACKDRAPGIPLIAHMTLDPRGRSFTGTPPEAAGVVMQSMGADAIGFNCSVGPDLLVDAIKRLAAVARVPVSVQPNAGLPHLGSDGRTVFPMGPEEFASYGPRLVAAGATIIGGCCGTTPEHIRLLRGAVVGLTPGSSPAAGGPSECVARAPAGPLGEEFCLTSRTQAVFAAEAHLPLIIGERINPTGRKALTRDITEGHFSLLRQQARAQVEAGAVILDVNVGVPLIDEALAMSRAVKAVQEATPVPVSIDSTSPDAIEAGLKGFVGKALVNSVSLEEGKAECLLPIAKRYGAAVLGLTIDEEGIPATAERRLHIARRLVEKAESYGIPRWDVVIDPLALTAGAQQSQAAETLKAVRLIRAELRCRTSLGVSNVSFGLPARSFLNAVYLNMALSAGLDMAIVNPTDERIMDTIRAARVFLNRDVSAKEYIEAVGSKRLVHTEDEALSRQAAVGGRESRSVAVGAANLGEPAPSAHGPRIRNAVLQGDKETIVPLIEGALRDGESPISLLDDHLIPAINQVGRLFAEGVYFLPQLMLSASAMKAAFEALRPEIARAKAALGGSSVSRGVVVLATVEGDIHDIGKNIVSVLMENHGFTVIDLGRDVKAETILEKAREAKADVVCLSALMTTTMPKMKEVVDLFAKEGFDCPVLIGGAATTRAFAEAIGAAGYGRDAQEAVEAASSVIERRGGRT
ncbi:MAG: homocysteine S-methyltransferase family protein [Bacillota bacterium]